MTVHRTGEVYCWATPLGVDMPSFKATCMCGWGTEWGPIEAPLLRELADHIEEGGL